MTSCSAELFVSIFHSCWSWNCKRNIQLQTTKNVYLCKNRHLQYWIIGSTKHLPKYILSSLGIFLSTWNILETVYIYTGLAGQGLVVNSLMAGINWILSAHSILDWLLTALKYFCINHGDQRIFFNLKSSLKSLLCISASFEYLCYCSRPL